MGITVHVGVSQRWWRDVRVSDRRVRHRGCGDLRPAFNAGVCHCSPRNLWIIWTSRSKDDAWSITVSRHLNHESDREKNRNRCKICRHFPFSVQRLLLRSNYVMLLYALFQNPATDSSFSFSKRNAVPLFHWKTMREIRIVFERIPLSEHDDENACES